MSLVSASGVPLRSSQGIPVIRHTPAGALACQFIRRPPNVEAAADRFLAQGGRYRVAQMPDGSLHFAATIQTDSDIYQLVAETSPNGPEHLDAVDRVVLASVKHMSAMVM